MAEPGSSEPADTTVAAPAAPAQESSASVFEQAKAELAQITETSPADRAQEAGTSAPAETLAPQEEGTRRQQGQQLREQIRKELETEYEQKRQADTARQSAEQAQKNFETLLDQAEGGDMQAAEQVVTMLRSNRATSAAIQQGRSAVLEELGRDITGTINGLDGLDEDGRTELMKAPSVADFGKRAFEAGRALERKAADDRIATLQAENESLKGRVAASRPSPATTGSGTPSSADPTKFKSIREAFAASAAELGYRGG